MIFHSHLLNKFKLKLTKNTRFSFLFSSYSSNAQPNLLHFSTLSQTKQVHAFAILHDFLPHSVSLSASLILHYSIFRHPTTSLLLFQNSVAFSRTAFLWTPSSVLIPFLVSLMGLVSITPWFALVLSLMTTPTLLF